MRDHRRAYVYGLMHEALSLQTRPNDEDVARFEALADEFELCPSTEEGIAKMERLQKEAFVLHEEIIKENEEREEREKEAALVAKEQARIAALPAPLHEEELARRLAKIEVGQLDVSRGIDPVNLDLVDSETTLTRVVEPATLGA